jgi:sec-independent protein translocase protein TatC
VTGAEEDRQPILTHLVELRQRLIVSSAAVVLGSIAAFVFRDWIFDVLVGPYRNIAEDLGLPDELTVIEVTEGFSLAMRMALFGGVVLASPALFYQAWAFVNPALTKRERRWAVPLVFALVVLFALGIAFAFWSMPRALDFLFGIQPGVQELIRADDYFKFTFRFLLVFGIAFQFPVFLFAAAAAGLVTSDQLKQGRRWATLIIVVVGAVVTPTGDPLTLMLLSTPLYLFYEATIWLVKLILRR